MENDPTKISKSPDQLAAAKLDQVLDLVKKLGLEEILGQLIVTKKEELDRMKKLSGIK